MKMNLKLVHELKEFMQDDPAVHAMWVGGSFAEGLEDDMSDVDVFIDIDDGKDLEMFQKVEKFLSTKGKLDMNFGKPETPPYSHKAYHIEGMDPYHYIEITMHTHSNDLGFIEDIHPVKPLFDKDGTIKIKPFSQEDHDKNIIWRKKFTQEKIAHGELSVIKEIKRGNFLEAIHMYQFWLVESVVELIRIRHCPNKISFFLKHASRDLPPDVVKQIESLYTYKSAEDLYIKINEVKALVNEYK